MNPLAPIEQAIRRGDIAAARQALERLSHRGGFAKANAARLANLQWRVGQPARGLRTLRAFLPGQEFDAMERFPVEAAEYAVCLIKLGAYEEAKYLLEIPCIAATPQGPLYRAFVDVETWGYASSIEPLSRYVKQPKISEYARLVGLANLACALVYERRHREAAPLLKRLLHDAHLSKNTFLLGFVLESAAMDSLAQKDFGKAKKFLDEAAVRWSKVEGLDKLFLNKWHAYLKLLSTPGADSLEAVREIRSQAERDGHWETLRDCDRYEAVATKNRDLFLQLYYGTPYPAFRDRLAQDVGAAVATEPHAVLWGKEGKAFEFNLLVDSKEQKRRGLSGQNLSLLALFLSDRYRPQRIAAIFGKMYPDEHYQPLSSPKRIRQSVLRLEQWFKSEKIPFSITGTQFGYYLVAHGRVAVRMPLGTSDTAAWRPLLMRLESSFQRNPFSIGDAEKKLSLPRRTLLRQIQSLAVSGRLEIQGAGRATCYVIADMKKKK